VAFWTLPGIGDTSYRSPVGMQTCARSRRPLLPPKQETFHSRQLGDLGRVERASPGKESVERLSWGAAVGPDFDVDPPVDPEDSAERLATGVALLQQGDLEAWQEK